MQGDSNPMHLHGHDMFVLAQGVGNFDAAKDRARYNLVDPPLKNTVVVPNLGWVAIRFVADNPGWYNYKIVYLFISQRANRKEFELSLNNLFTPCATNIINT